MKMLRIALSVVLAAAVSMLSGCGKENAAVGVIGGADGPTAVVVGEQVEPWEYDMYADELVYNYDLYVAAREEFDIEYFGADADGTIAASKNCIAALDGLIAVVPPATVAQYHEELIAAAEYEKEVYSGAKMLAEFSKRADSLTAEENAEAERIGAVIAEYYEQPTYSLSDAWIAAIEAATKDANGVFVETLN
ncbi:MAG: hypothetical protein IJZ47_03775 [Oscillospiraceae bacterium]|nr:hypothetical protein [Oscillospiraceae bacterium]